MTACRVARRALGRHVRLRRRRRTGQPARLARVHATASGPTPSRRRVWSASASRRRRRRHPTPTRRPTPLSSGYRSSHNHAQLFPSHSPHAGNLVGKRQAAVLDGWAPLDPEFAGAGWRVALLRHVLSQRVEAGFESLRPWRSFLLVSRRECGKLSSLCVLRRQQ